jgi:NAD+ synthase (glutamine-hydrolysing)
MRLALAQLNPTVGDIGTNAASIVAAVATAREAGADLLATTELAISGYPPKDLLLMEGFVASCERAAREIGAAHAQGLTLIIGTPIARPHGAIANGLLAFRDGACIAEYDKRLLPTYDVFDEDRYFEPGSRPVVIDVPTHAGTSVRVGLASARTSGRDRMPASAAATRASPTP